ncbi:TolC family protein [Galbibacter sp. BG1]|uniref:TolC family protein n=1 Tax=Galbibacter sp. BG1 TaxID=1170699 RepID=UPI0015C14A43|nr:TolC family protein [Galbibacter sp. BG1]QLE01536.1 TolC family protein [Galbibacter sp. BG1]
MTTNRNINNVFLIVLLFLFVKISAQETYSLSLEEAKNRALSKNKLLKIQEEKVREANYKINAVSSKGKPLVYGIANYMHTFRENNFIIPEGGIGDFLTVPIPFNDFNLYSVDQDIFTAGIIAYQPITQLFRIRNGVDAATAEASMEQTEARIASARIISGIEKLFYAVKIEEAKIAQLETDVALSKTKLYDVESALQAGETNEVSRMGLQAELAKKEYDLLQTEIDRENYLADLKVMLEFDEATNLQLDSLKVQPYLLESFDYYWEEAQKNSPELINAQKQKEMAQYGVSANKNVYLPDLGLIGGATYQNIVPEFPETNYFIGANLIWNIIGFGNRKSELAQSKSKEIQATLFEENTQSDLKNKVAKAYKNAEQAERLITIAQKAYFYRKEAFRIKTNERNTGLTTEKELLEFKVELQKAKQEAFAASLNFNMAVLDLKVLAGLIVR